MRGLKGTYKGFLPKIPERNSVPRDRFLIDIEIDLGDYLWGGAHVCILSLLGNVRHQQYYGSEHSWRSLLRASPWSHDD
jgi:hypothetical protein